MCPRLPLSGARIADKARRTGDLGLAVEELPVKWGERNCPGRRTLPEGTRPHMSSHNQKRALGKKKKALARQRRNQKLRRDQGRPTFLPPHTVVVHDPPGMEKMSEVLLDFVEPYLDSAPTEEALRKLLVLAVVAWNAALLPTTERDKFIQESENALPPDARADFRTVLDPLIARKLAHFATIRRGIFEFKLSMRSSGPYLQVMSTMPGE